MTDLTPQNSELSGLGHQLETVSGILASLDDVPKAPNAETMALENELVSVRLGTASSLFNALRVRHGPTAAHCLRVALGCSSWSRATDMDQRQRDELEVAALLHDIGKIGAPDEILRQSTALTYDQAAQINETRKYGLEILSSCCDSPEILQTVAYVGAWFDGSRPEFQLRGEQIPLGARMVSIVDAFDAMTTDRVYRKAISQERAIAELFTCSSTQFDPALVDHFAWMHSEQRLSLDDTAARRWLQSLSEVSANRYWRLTLAGPGEKIQPNDDNYHDQLFNSIHEGVFLVNASGYITEWNYAAERMTGISTQSVLQQKWDPSLLKMKVDTGRYVRLENCPIHRGVSTGLQSREDVMIQGRNMEFLQIDLQVVPVIRRDGARMGIMALMRDATSEFHLEERVHELHKKATRDPLTRLSNRAEFDRRHKESVADHGKKQATCSLIICDIDRFKSINDEYGHQAGDEALVQFSEILQRRCRLGDLVARYGGEEFVMVCEDCSSAAATKIAEDIRKELESTPMRELNGRRITASFGVTELQPGDTPETMLRRADRGLLQAKDTGRNKVVQLGSGMENTGSESSGWWPWTRNIHKKALSEFKLSTNVPLPLVAEKLRGFVADHGAEIVTISREHVVIQISTASFYQSRRSTDRPIPFQLQLDFEYTGDSTKGRLTIINVKLHPTRTRDRRTDVSLAAKLLSRSLRSYLMAQTYHPAE